MARGLLARTAHLGRGHLSQLTDFVKVALLGTQREPLPEIDSDRPFAGLLKQLPKSTPEQTLLSRLAVISLYEQMGQQSGPLPSTLPPRFQLAEEKSSCTRAAGRHLAIMIEGHYQEALPEFLTALNEARQRLPEQFLPNLLDRAAKLATLRPLLLPGLGQVGRWLAGQNPTWLYAAPELDTWDGLTQQWRDDSPAMRQTLLRQLRYIEPAKGRQLLSSTWKTETPASRALLIKILEIGLSMADEPFLETALDDRSLVVRRKAAELLAGLPTSRLCQRMTKNTSGLLSWDPRQNQPIIVNFPRQLSPQMLRDGVSIPNTKNLAHARATQIIEMVAALPLQVWTEAWPVEPPAIIEAALESRWPTTLMRGFSLAAERQKNPVWAKALLLRDGFTITTIRLLPLLTPLDFEAVVQQLSPATPTLSKDAILLKVLQKWPHPWSDTVVELWLSHLIRHVEQDTQAKTPEPTLRATLRHFAKRCPPALAEAVAGQWQSISKGDSIWAVPVQETIAMLKFRRAMLAEIKALTPVAGATPLSQIGKG